MAELPTSADVIVIGGGVMGTSTLYHLAANGCTNAILVERDTIAAGSTSKAAGGIRAQFSDELNIRIALENIARFSRFSDEFGVDIDYRQWGYLFLLSEASLTAFQDNVELQRRLGVPVELLTPEEASSVVAGIHLDGIAGATFCGIDGHATPETVAQAYSAAARALGASVVQGCTVNAITVDDGVVVGVTTAAGHVSAPIVVCTAGVWTPELTGPIGLDLPVTPEKRYVWLTEAPDPLPHQIPLTIDFDTSFYFQREGDRLLFGGKVPSLEALAPDAVRRLPFLADVPIRDGWWGYYAMSPDHNAIVGRTLSPDGLLYATGFSGHGFQQAPVVGEYLAQSALALEPSFDLSPFAVERFATDTVRPEANVV